MSARFKVYVTREFRKLKEEEAKRLESSRTWHISKERCRNRFRVPKITDYVDNARILLDAIPRQLPQNVRVNYEEEE